MPSAREAPLARGSSSTQTRALAALPNAFGLAPDAMRSRSVMASRPVPGYERHAGRTRQAPCPAHQEPPP